MARIYMCPCIQTKTDQTKRCALLVVMAVIILSFLTLVISGLSTLSTFKTEVAASDPLALHYGIVIDCGSSGSRLYVYYWPPHSSNPHDLLNIQQLLDSQGKPVVKKVSPGLSTFENRPEDASNHIRELLLYAEINIPKEKHKETPLYILATAGMRMIPKEAQEAILKDLQKDIVREFDFLVAESHFEVISGKTEGVYAWIAVNYALDRFSHKNGKDAEQELEVKLPDGKFHRRSRTVGMIDMGGGSVQIAFEVTDENQIKNIPRELIAEFNLGCQETDIEHYYRVYVTTFLGYGANSAIDRYYELLAKNDSSLEKSRGGKKKSILDPCMPVGMPLRFDVHGTEYSFTGAGNYMKCQARLEPLLNLSVPCSQDPCSMNGIHQPQIDHASAQFYGFSEFWYTMEDVYRIGGTYRYDTFESYASKFCASSWTQLSEWYKKNLYPKADDHRFRFECFKSAWLSVVFHKGFHFPVTYSHFQSAQLIGGKDVQWTLGALIYRTRFLPLRDLDPSLQSHPQSLIQWRNFYSEYLIIACFVIVLAAIILYMKRLRLCPRSANLSRVPSMSYFMTDENQIEQGIRYVKGQGYL